MIWRVLICFMLSIFFPVLHSQNWQQVGTGCAYGVRCLYTDTLHNKLIGSGGFWAPNGIDTMRIAQWDGTMWDSLASGIAGGYSGVDAITLYNGEIIIGGDFTTAGGITARGLARWNGTQWDSVGTGTYAGIVHDMLSYNNDLYVIGIISGDGGLNYYSVLKFNGTGWEVLPNSPPCGLANYNLRAIDLYNNEIYIGGAMWSDSSRNILKWDGNNWRAVGVGVPDGNFTDAIKDFHVYHDKLYIGGSMVGGFDGFGYAYYGIANWDGTGYTLPGGGIHGGAVYDMTVFNDTLYAVGFFNDAGGIPADCIAKWDGTNWCSLGSTFNGAIRAIEVYNNELYIGGDFSQIDGFPIKRIAKWTGGSYTENCGNTTGIFDENQIEEINFYPNPTSGIFNLKLATETENIFIEIFDVHGRKLKILSSNIINEAYQVDISSFPSGIYFANMVFDNTYKSFKLIKN